MIASTQVANLFRLTLRLGFALVVAAPATVFAARDVIEFPEDELAAESVLPVFDDPVAVKNRRVTTQGRFEIGLLGGYSMMEPFYNPVSYGGTATYHLTEEHGINVIGLMYGQGLNNNGKGLNPIPGAPGNPSANLQFAPAPKYLFLGNYQFTGFYGKISVTKNFVMNLSTYGLLGLGMFGVGDGSFPIASAGIGQKLYFGPSFALRFDLRFMGYQGPDVLSKNLSLETQVKPASYFDQKLNFTSLLSVGAVFLFPGM